MLAVMAVLLAAFASMPANSAPTAPAAIAAAAPDSTASASTESAASESTATDSLALPYRLSPMTLVRTDAPAHARLVEPAGVAADAFGRVYVSDAALHRLERFDPAGAWLGESGALGSEAGLMRRPGAVTALGAVSVAVLDRENRRVLSYDLFGKLIGTLIELSDSTLVDRVGRVEPCDLAADRGGAVYVVDCDGDRVLAFDFNGRYLRAIGGYGAKPGSFRGLRGLAVGRRGEIVTSERTGARIQRLDPGGRVLASWGIPVRPSRAALPVAVNDSGHVAVADESSGRLMIFDSSGRMLAAASGLDAPRALAFTPDGALLVAEAGAGRVRRFALERNPRGSAPRER